METKQLHPLLIAFFKHFHTGLRAFNKLRMKLTGDHRPGSYPYIAGDSFRAIADHIHDDGIDIDPAAVKAGDTVFVSNGRTRSYLKEFHPRIQHPYVLIEHNGDYDIDMEVADLLDDKIIKFYAQDVVYEHEKIIPIPIALENRWLYMNGIPWVFRILAVWVKFFPPRKKARILYRFSIHTNPAFRGPLLEFFKKQPLMETFTEMLPPILHLNKLKGYMFVASPRGNSIESCRTWEALFLRTVPIVQDFVAMKYFASLGLPMWLVHDWQELDGLTEERIIAKYAELMKNPNFEPLYMDFWINMIRADQEKARNMATNQA